MRHNASSVFIFCLGCLKIPHLRSNLEFESRGGKYTVKQNLAPWSGSLSTPFSGRAHKSVSNVAKWNEYYSLQLVKKFPNVCFVVSRKFNGNLISKPLWFLWLTLTISTLDWKKIWDQFMFHLSVKPFCCEWNQNPCLSSWFVRSTK